MPQPAPTVNGTRMRTTLKMAISKIKFLQEKKTALTKQQRRQLADLMAAGKESSAKIRVENIIRDDIYIELLEYCELYCELLLARLQMVLDPARPHVEAGLSDAVLLLIYCSGHTEIKELATLSELLRVRYGPEYTRTVLDNVGGVVPEKIVKRCVVDPPAEQLVSLYLAEIARAYGVPFSEMEVLGDEEPEPEKAEEAPAEKQEEAKPLSEFDQLKARFANLKR